MRNLNIIQKQQIRNPRNKRFMIIGGRKSGKTSIANLINGTFNPKEKPRQSQDTIYTDKTLDVPAAYLEQTCLYRNILSLVQDAKCVIFIIDATKFESPYSPSFAQALQCKNIIGVITKTDIKPENVEHSKSLLKKAGVEEPYFEVDLKNNLGTEELLKHLHKI